LGFFFVSRLKCLCLHLISATKGNVTMSMLSSVGNDTHVWVSEGKTWAEAQSFCREYYTDLASVRSRTELQQILRITNGSAVWIGLYRNRLWSDQSNSTFTYWRPEVQFAPSEPDNGVYTYEQYGNQHCTAVHYLGYWTDEDCLSSFPFICYTKMCYVFTITRAYKCVFMLTK
uniref:C-type lectin domain-containing protein n=1 Tax=Pygocentrus nattereri TaxID=42514 RepID=A0A3B4D7L6_PYGNA